MCIIAIKPASKPMFDEAIIRTMFSNNPHGAGLMFKKSNGKVHIEKGFMKVEPLLKYVKHHKRELENTDVVMHFRITTSGKTDELGCHPYSVWGRNTSTSVDVELAMAHNGMLDRCGWHGNTEINDTQVFIKDCLKKLPHNFLKNRAICDLIGNAIDTNKLAFLGENGIKTFGDFVREDGYFFSNRSFEERTYTVAKPTYTSSSWGSNWYSSYNNPSHTKGKKDITKYDDCDCCSSDTNSNELYMDSLLDNKKHKVSEIFALDILNAKLDSGDIYECQNNAEFEYLLEIAQKNLKEWEEEDCYDYSSIATFYNSEYIVNFDIDSLTIEKIFYE